MNKRERVLTALQLEEPDKVPIHNLGFEKTGTAYQYFIEWDGIEDYVTLTPVGDLTEVRFWNQDINAMDPFQKMKIPRIENPPEYPECRLDYAGRLHKTGRNEKTGLAYGWYYGPYFTKEEIIRDFWDRYGKPTDMLADLSDITRKKWESYVKTLEDIVFPAATLPIAPFESLFEGIGPSRLAYFMRKKPSLIHEIMREYRDVNLEIIKAYGEAGVEVLFMFDDLGQKERTLLSMKNFKEFILPYYREMYQAAKKRGIFFIQHSCGFIEPFLPLMADAGLSCIQVIEPTAGNDLGKLKAELGDKIAFMGGMDSSRILNFGTPEEVEEDVKKCIKAAAPGGGYFAGPAHNIMDTPWENIMAFRAAIEKYRDYPISL